MNAGAYGGEMRDVLSGVTVLDQKGGIQHLDAEEPVSYTHLYDLSGGQRLL